mgnify:CR=1 FL=1|tara:strand:+ start:3578 stop:4666 length:1089 start_codon:yes stop_codon:yes gene_type:complete
MRIGVPKEIKNNEHRVGLTPDSVRALVMDKHEIFIESNAGLEIGFTDDDYVNSGATILDSAKDLYKSSELIVKVKEPIKEEYKFLSKDHTIFAYLHLAGDIQSGLELTSTGVTGIALETVTSEDGSMPLLSPMSAIAGELSIVVGSYHLLKPNKGMGILIGSCKDIKPRIVTVIGAGVAGTEAIQKALANGSYVKVIDLSENRLKELKDHFGDNNIEYIVSSESNITDALRDSDLVIGAVYVIGREAPKVVSTEMLKQMKDGAVMVDISIDQGGCFESSKPTNHDSPTYVENGVLHYCVTNMPGAVPLTATHALNEVTLPYIQRLANQGINKALKDDEHLANGLNIQDGEVVHPAVKKALNL